ncbi:ABC transporter ATP-binding protein [Riemerella columbipharyngis]|uniref:ATP-binding cassette, subfamily B, MsbA n=1 Tax=Riemerella columbipharyngis TaxID=1071918 RepID=A0A1G7CXT4_9FLAO|nr:ABC transporter ATP-binding protein [Riemerella columbipharyngis]SDE43476.1 ATP-binding cassette, subfamily B, MsbA [Riemerella columbipharyngis]
MKKKKESKIGYFSYFKGIIGWHVYSYIFLNILLGFLDGIGLAFFVPLLSIASGDVNKSGDSLGKLEFIIEGFDKLGIELNLTNALLFLTFLFGFKGIIYYFRIIYFSKLQLNAISKLRMKLVTGLESLSYSGFTKLDLGRIQNTMIGELGKLMGAFNSYFGALQHLIMLLTYIGLAFFSNWRFAILVAIGGALSNILYKFVNKYTKQKAREISKKGHDFNGLLIQALHNFKYLKATNYLPSFSKKLETNIYEQKDLNFKISKVGGIAESLREPMIITIIAVVIMIQLAFFNNSFSSIIVSLLLFYRALAHLVTLQNTWNGFLVSTSGVESFNTLMDEFKDYQENQTYSETIDNIGDIEIKNINLSFDGDKKVLDNINFTIKKNTSVAFVGESGAGKTTLANIISGLQHPDSGEVLVDGKSLYKTRLGAYRSHIGYITQEPVIFDDTVFNNVTFWSTKNETNLNRFRDIMNKVALKPFLENLPKKEDSPLGNNGILISGGQKQRVSIARELYKDVGLLVMDEATSALDSETERRIKNSIDMIHGQSTLLIIAHRLSTIKDVDIIYLMDKGKIIASGNFGELYEKSDKFKKMVELQEV